MAYELRLYKDELAPAAPLDLKAHGVTAIYVFSGGLRIRTSSFNGVLGPNSAFHTSDDALLSAGNLATVALRWRLTQTGAPDALATGNGVTSTKLLAAPMQLDPSQAYLLRCDRVDFPAGGEALTHTHKGGGIRCLLSGGINIHTNNTVHRYLPLEPWFEAGPDAVYAKASPEVPSAFARVMVLPQELLGKSSITYVNAEDVDKPKNQKYQVFIDTPITLPA
ncbi:MAG: hypothetical protein ABL891_01095 [Burkholderiales bacterium]